MSKLTVRAIFYGRTNEGGDSYYRKASLLKIDVMSKVRPKKRIFNSTAFRSNVSSIHFYVEKHDNSGFNRVLLCIK